MMTLYPLVIPSLRLWLPLFNKLDLAVEWLEQGRSIVWGQILNLRTPVDEVRAVRPDLARELGQVSRDLEIAGIRGDNAPIGGSKQGSMTTLEDEAQAHRRLAKKYDKLLVEVRSIAGFEEFLLPKKLYSFHDATKYGPIVLVNVHQSRCDALIICKNDSLVRHVPLVSITHDDAENLRRSLISALKNAGVRDRADKPYHGIDHGTTPAEIMPTILAKLWEGVAKPVLITLGYIGTMVRKISLFVNCVRCSSTIMQNSLPSTPLPHISWCATGPLTFLPLHAAGVYDEPGDPRIYDYVVSSFTPSVTALLEACKRSTNASPSILAVSQPSTPGQSQIPGTITEINAIRLRANEDSRVFQWLNEDDATVEAVLLAMRQHGWCHFACHGIQNAQDPMKSSFALHDGPLELKTIMANSFASADMAFLSACQTATGDEKRSEESVHLAAGMLMAGYRTVFATMWSIGDTDAPLIADAVYSYLLQERRGNLDLEEHSLAAYALHHAVACLRSKEGEFAFVKWLPFIHIGV